RADGRSRKDKPVEVMLGFEAGAGIAAISNESGIPAVRGALPLPNPLLGQGEGAREIVVWCSSFRLAGPR
ncbi:MAG TPA: hypothetical protein VN754_11300, partial [Candidatus Binataceae bacterium]|nr:hypothetical protein [Candidatus Binataceae bacterium]